MHEKAFDDIAVLLPHAERHSWILGWCARMVWIYARNGDVSVLRALRFWDAVLRIRPHDQRAQRERLLCLAYGKMHGQPVAITYERFVAEVTEYLEVDSTYLMNSDARR